MKKLKGHEKFFCFTAAVIFFTSMAVFSQTQEPPAEVKALVGTYTGSWIMYGLDASGKVVEKMKWTDTMTAANPQVKEDRAFVETVDRMTFSGNIPPQQVKGTEGYILNKDGSLGDYYFENFGQLFKMLKLGRKTWVYSMAANPGRLAFLGFSNVVSGSHVVVKEVTEENGLEVHRISRVTTINWKGKDGTSKWKQFISLRGYHRRMKS